MVGPVIRAGRLARGWTQLDLAIRAGLPTSTISRIERGAIQVPHPATLNKLSRVLALSVTEIYQRGGVLRDPAEPGK